MTLDQKKGLERESRLTTSFQGLNEQVSDLTDFCSSYFAGDARSPLRAPGLRTNNEDCCDSIRHLEKEKWKQRKIPGEEIVPGEGTEEEIRGSGC